MNATKNGIASIKMKRILINICKYVLLIFAAFVALVPIVSCIFTAFKTKEEYASTNVITLPKSFLNFDNFIIAWNKASMGKAFLNSFIILICVLVGSILISAMLAYVLNRFKFPGNKLIRNLFTIATLIPGIASQVTVYQIMTALHLVNSMPGYIILMMGTDVITIYIFLQFFENLSPTLDESAILDGCTYFGVFFKILLPLLKPAIVTSALPSEKSMNFSICFLKHSALCAMVSSVSIWRISVLPEGSPMSVVPSPIRAIGRFPAI